MKTHRKPQAKRLAPIVKLPMCRGVLGPEAFKFGGKTHCSNLARYRVEGQNLCARHAAQAALQILLRGAK